MLNRVSSERIQLGPPSNEDLGWIMSELRRPEISRALGWENGIGAEVYGGYVEGTVLLLPFSNRVRERVGFIMLMRPSLSVRAWSVNIVVPDPVRRNAFTALAACDALGHLVFDVRGDVGLVWRIEPSNGASIALPKRLGCVKCGDVIQDGTTYEQYVVDQADWAAHQARLRARRSLPTYTVEEVPLTEVGHGRILAVVRSRSGEQCLSSP